MELQELIDAGNDVVMVTRHYGKGRASGAAVQAVVAYVWTVDDGQRFRIFNTRPTPSKPWVAASRWPLTGSARRRGGDRLDRRPARRLGRSQRCCSGVYRRVLNGPGDVAVVGRKAPQLAK
jgi:hypothetical protein